MNKTSEKIEKQIASLQKKIDSLSGNYLTNTPKRQREQRDRYKKIERWRCQKQVLEFLSETVCFRELDTFENALLTGTFYEQMRWFFSQKEYYKEHPEYTPRDIQYPINEDSQKQYKKADIHNTADLIKAVDMFEELIKNATIPPDPNVARIRDLTYEARNSQGGDIQFAPPEIAGQLVNLAEINEHSKVLEPEAGIAFIADEVKKITSDIDCIEQMYSFRELLQLKGYNLIGLDFLECEPAPIYDAVVMNPPFSAECKHIRHAYRFLKPGGKLVSLCCNRVFHPKNREYEDFWEWLNQHGARFREVSGKFESTQTNTKIIVMKKVA